MNTNTGGRKRRRRRDLNSENDIDNIKKFINQPMSELILAFMRVVMSDHLANRFLPFSTTLSILPPRVQLRLQHTHVM